MTVEDENVVDIISVKQDAATVRQQICDHLDWTDTVRHQTLIQNKLNRYLAFVESGEMLESYPAAKGLAVEFEIVFKFRPDSSAEAFLRAARQVVETAGFAFRATVFAESYDN